MEQTKNHASSIETGYSISEIAAHLTGSRPEEVLAAHITPDGAMVVVDQTGRKWTFSRDQVRLAEKSTPDRTPSNRTVKRGRK